MSLFFTTVPVLILYYCTCPYSLLLYVCFLSPKLAEFVSYEQLRIFYMATLASAAGVAGAQQQLSGLGTPFQKLTCILFTTTCILMPVCTRCYYSLLSCPRYLLLYVSRIFTTDYLLLYVSRLCTTRMCPENSDYLLLYVSRLFTTVCVSTIYYCMCLDYLLLYVS